MAKPQLENGHTRIANELLEHLMKIHLSPNQWQVLLCIIRKTYGYQKKVDYIANSQIVEATCLGKTVVSRALRVLVDMRIIYRKKKYTGIEKDWERWIKLAELSTIDTKLAIPLTDEKLAIQSTELAEQLTELAELSTKVSSPRVAQKKKETIQKKLYKRNAEIPDWIEKEIWDGFLEVRREKKAAATEYALSLIIKELEKFKASGDDPNEVLKRSITNSWKGVFPLKGGRDGKGGGHNQPAPGRRYTTPEQYRNVTD